jgi:uncharacterized iron-regulated membrane protein
MKASTFVAKSLHSSQVRFSATPTLSSSAEIVFARTKMTAWQRWVNRPQSLWIRKAFFQVHLWVGVGIGLYVLAISVSGSAIVYRNRIIRNSSPNVVVVAPYGPRLSVDELTQYAQLAYPTYIVDNIRESQSPNQPDDVVLERRNKRMERLFDPYTGADLGDPYSATDRTVGWFVDLHDNLLAGQTGRLANGIGAIFVTLLSLTGVILWWPGIKNWRRSTTINWQAHFPRINWDLHSAIGFWCSLFVMVWGISGIYFCFPLLFRPLVGGSFLFWISQLHIGRFNGLTEALWTILGLVPAILFVTGGLMWWNRVLRKKFRHP